MIGSLLTRGLVMVLGYAYPAFECYKTVEKNKIEIKELRFWCQYWILVAMLTVTERIGDVFISWVPMYSEAKLAFYLYLWYPKTRGTTYVYDSFFKPYMAKHESEIDRSLLELKTRAGDIAVIYWQKAASYAQTSILDIMQFVASQTTLKPHPAQPEQAPHRTTSATIDAQPQTEEPLSPTSSTSSSCNSQDVTEVTPPAPSPSAPLPPNSSTRKLKLFTAPTVQVSLPIAETSAEASSSQFKPDVMEIDDHTIAASHEQSKLLKVTVMDETLKITSAKLRKNRTKTETAKK